MTQYYFLATLLPQLQIGVPPEINSRELKAFVEANVPSGDKEKVYAIRLYADLQNLRSFLRGEPFSAAGNFNENQLEEAVLTRSGFPDYVYDFLERYDSKEERLKNFTHLFAHYFRSEVPKQEGFLHDYLLFERERRLVLTALRAKRLGRDLLEELQFEDPDDDFVVRILAQKDNKEYEPPERYADLKGLYEEHADNPLELHKALAEYRYARIGEIAGIKPFSIDRILAYIARLEIVEKWLELDKRKGMEIVEQIVREST